MMVSALEIPGSWLFRPLERADSRGVFMEIFTEESIRRITQEPFDVAQLNLSRSARNVVRGVHGSLSPPGQSKYVTCVSGEVLDCVVDLRPNSLTFGKWDSALLDGRNPSAIMIARGLGHAFQVLSDSATVVYATSSRYDPESEFAVNPLDPDLRLPWWQAADLILSDRDRSAPSLRELQESQLL